MKKILIYVAIILSIIILVLYAFGKYLLYRHDKMYTGLDYLTKMQLLNKEEYFQILDVCEAPNNHLYSVVNAKNQIYRIDGNLFKPIIKNSGNIKVQEI